jgi:hypothetical protein
MQKENRDPGPSTLKEASEALDQLIKELLHVPGAYEAFMRLKESEQISLVDWVDFSSNELVRARRVRMISGVLGGGSEVAPLGDAIWLD